MRQRQLQQQQQQRPVVDQVVGVSAESAAWAADVDVQRQLVVSNYSFESEPVPECDYAAVVEPVGPAGEFAEAIVAVEAEDAANVEVEDLAVVVAAVVAA